MRKLIKEGEKIELSKEDQIMEFLALGLCFLVLFASAVKVVFL
jgi:hypothetical protein